MVGRSRGLARWAVPLALGVLVAGSVTGDGRTDDGPAARSARALGARARQADAVVRVLSLGCGGFALGSGVVVPGGRVLTNRHVVAGADYVEVRRSDGVRIGARVERVGRDVDLAELWVGDAAGPGVVLRGRLQPRQQVTVLGHPGGGPAVVAAGPVTARALAVDGIGAGDAAWVDVPVAAGSSGGPAFAAAGPEAVGVVAAVEHHTGLAAVIDGEVAARFLTGDLPAEAGAGPCVAG